MVARVPRGWRTGKKKTGRWWKGKRPWIGKWAARNVGNDGGRKNWRSVRTERGGKVNIVRRFGRDWSENRKSTREVTEI